MKGPRRSEKPCSMIHASDPTSLRGTYIAARGLHSTLAGTGRPEDEKFCSRDIRRRRCIPLTCLTWKERGRLGSLKELAFAQPVWLNNSVANAAVRSPEAEQRASRRRFCPQEAGAALPVTAKEADCDRLPFGRLLRETWALLAASPLQQIV
ncbi:hypothetical protein NDU88_000226 [Pleurodeles waltl]|uniref:Uncharacterized protein n=1 Tax=Pleurodeles waltl TaxID=8319 RepID=A0AAV7S4L4_PLEWA|nr:hypothetical protein NDU88_000226 [Pleurodeles waltl]